MKPGDPERFGSEANASGQSGMICHGCRVVRKLSCECWKKACDVVCGMVVAVLARDARVQKYFARTAI